MRQLRTLLAIALLGLAAPALGQSLAITNAQAWTGTGGAVVTDATIVIRDGRIASVTSGGPAPSDATIIDATGRPVTPGLFAAATQIGLLEVAGADDTSDEAVDSGKLGAAFDVAPAISVNSLLIAQARADGVLWALSYPTGSGVPPFLGQAAMLRLQPHHVLERPRAAMFVSIGGSAASNAGGSRAAQWTLLRKALDEARLLQAGQLPGADERLFGRLDLEALGPVLAGTMPLAIQTHRQSDLRQALQLAADYRLKLVLVGATEAWTMAADIARAGVPVVLDPSANLPMSHDELGARRDNAAILHGAGVVLALAPSANTIDRNYNVGAMSRISAGLAVGSGLPYPAAIRALTLGPARIWGAAGQTGSIEPGKLADLVIWDGDPLEATSAPATVLVGGRPVPTVTREQLLTRRYSAPKDDQWPPAYRR